ncbi:MAG: DsbA family protein, partial [Hyphomicrobiaceae bacterium]
ELPDNILGDPDAPVTMIEYSSMTCPHCARFHTGVLGDFKKKYIDTGKVKYIIREFPLDNLATAAFMLARCAGPDKYFPFVDALYAQQEKWAFVEKPVEPLRELAKQAGFTRETFDKCLKDQKLVDGILWIRKRGADEFKVSATPTFFINGRKLKGSSSIEGLSAVIDPLLKDS